MLKGLGGDTEYSHFDVEGMISRCGLSERRVDRSTPQVISYYYYSELDLTLYYLLGRALFICLGIDRPCTTHTLIYLPLLVLPVSKYTGLRLHPRVSDAK